MAIYMWRDYRIFTISWEEKSDMSSWWTYSDDAAWLTAGSWAFDDFFWYSAVLLNTSWTETATMSQSWWVFSWWMSTLGNITSWDNVMIKFPKRWIKMTKNWSIVTLSITDAPDLEWYQYYAFNSWWQLTYQNRNSIYIWAYKWYYNWTALKSWSGQTWVSTQNYNLPRINYITPDYACNYAMANGSGYHAITWYMRQYINALYMMKYGNPDAATVVWPWYIGWSTYQATWATDSITSATWATDTTKTWRIKLFWLEDRWGNLQEFVDGIESLWWSSVKTDMWQDFASSGHIKTFDVSSISAAHWYMSSIVWNNTWMFISSSSWWSATTYYRSQFSLWWRAYLAGVRFNWNYNWIFMTSTDSYDSTDTGIWCRLVYL